MNIEDLIPGRKIFSRPDELEQTARLIKDHYCMQLGAFVSLMQEEASGVQVYSQATTDPLWNHTALLPGAESAFLSNFEKIAAAALRLRRCPGVYLVAQSPQADEVAEVLSKADFEVLKTESWMVYEGGKTPQASLAHLLEVKQVETETQLRNFVDIFNEVFGSKSVYLGDAVKAQFYELASPHTRHFIGYAGKLPVCIATLISNSHGSACIYNVGVRQAHRRQGYGAAMTTHLIEQSGAARQKILFLQVDHDSTAQRLYQELGFVSRFQRISLLQTGAVIPEHQAIPFWKAHLKDIEIPTLLPHDDISPLALSPQEEARAVEYREIPPAVRQAAARLEAQYEISFEALMIAVSGMLFGRYCNQEIALPGLAFADKMAGRYIAPLPITLHPTMDFLSLSRQAAELKNRIAEFDPIPLLEIQECSSIAQEHPLIRILLEFTLGNPPRSFKADWIYTLVCRFDQEQRFFEIDYDRLHFTKCRIKRLAGHLSNLLAQVLAHPGQPIASFEIITSDEKQEILTIFNNTKTDYPAAKTVPQLFVEQVEMTPDRAAVFAADATGISVSWLSYKKLDEEADGLAGLLLRKGIGFDTPVGLMIERSPEMLVGVLAILKAGAAYLPISPKYPAQRKKYMIKDSSARLLLTGRSLSKELEGFKSLEFETIFIEDRRGEPDTSPRLYSLGMAYIIYTSGSTGAPKGVAVNNRNIVRLVKNTDYVDFRPDDRILPTGALEFDASTFEIWGALLNGLALHLVNDDVILSPAGLKEAIRKHKITILWLTSPLFNQLLQEDIEIFSSLRNLLVGGDVLSPPHIEKLREKYPLLNIINGYGPTENTTFSTTYLIDKRHEGNIPIGKPIANSTAHIIDRYGLLQPVGVAGELLVGGDGVARGYLNNPELTAEKFVFNNRSYKSYRSYGSYSFEKLYKTGDLACWLPDGNIEFLGRIDFQVKIRGFRVELGEIEAKLLDHESVKEAAAVYRSDGKGDGYICVYIVQRNPGVNVLPSFQELREFLSQKLPEYMIPSFFVNLEKLPLTANGKLDRKRLPEPQRKGLKKYCGPRDELEKKLTGTWSDVLKIDYSTIGIDDNFFELGGHSLKGAILLARLHKELNVRLEFAELFQYPTISSLARYIKNAAKAEYRPIKAATAKDYYVLSPAQKRMYILDTMEFAGVNYNIPSLFILAEEPDRAKLADTFRKIISRHESFRTSFHIVSGQPMQKVHSPVEIRFELEYYDNHTAAKHNDKQLPGDEAAPAEAIHTLVRRFIQPFDLAKAPLLRAALSRLADGRKLLMVDIHHIVFDGVSLEIFKTELVELYEGKELYPLPIQYKDYAEWQVNEIDQSKIKTQQEYWVKYFAGDIPVLSMPTDYPRPRMQSFAGATRDFVIGPEATAALKELAAAENVTLFMVLAALVHIFLAKLSGQEEIVLGAPVAGRNHPDVGKIIGMFVNTLAFRSFPAGEKSFREFLREIKQDTLAAFENQDYPFENLVEILNINRDASRNPIFDVMFNFLESAASKQEQEIPALKLMPYKYNDDIAKFDLTIFVQYENEMLSFCMQYCSKLFKQETIDRYINYLKKIAASAPDAPGIRLAHIEIITDSEKRDILYGFSGVGTGYPREKTIIQLFTEQAEMTPDRAAVAGPAVAAGVSFSWLSYKQLDEEAVILAGLLLNRGIVGDTPVGLMVERSLEMLIGVLAILKSGAAYLPISPKYPVERKKYMLKDSSARLLLTTHGLSKEVEELRSSTFETLFIEDRKGAPGVRSCGRSSWMAYIIYTSGSTGQPKGVMVDNRNVVRLVKNTNYVDFRPDDRILPTGALEFDASTFEIWGALLNGLALRLENDDVILSPAALKEAIRKHKITILWLTSPLFNQLLQEDIEIFSGLRNLLVGGDVLSPPHIDRLREEYTLLKIINGYGPTENTTFSTTYLIAERHEGSIPIGKPIANSTAYIVDRFGRLQPVGIAGELLVGGDGVARGYLNNPELTAEKFKTGYRIKNTKLTDYHSPLTTHQSPFTTHLYKTGDLARWRPDGNIEFLGRMDYQVKIRGFRVELGEIEVKLLEHESIKEAVVISRSDGKSDYYICAYIVVGSAGLTAFPGVQELREFLLQELPEYMIPSFFVNLEKLPLTANGKIDRKQLPEPKRGGFRKYRVPRDELEKRLVSIWSDVLKIESSAIGIDDNFFELGGHSLRGAILLPRILKELGVRISLAVLFRNATIARLAKYIKDAVREEYIRDAEREEYTAIEAVEKREYYITSSMQKRLFVVNEFETGRTAYNLGIILQVEGELDYPRLQGVFRKLIDRHESLRTSFVMQADEPVQTIHQPDEIKFSIDYCETDDRDVEHEVSAERQSIDTIIRAFIRPFDLTTAPLFRVGLILDSAGGYMLMIDSHHIVFDGTSLQILWREFMELYVGKDLPPLQIQYRDYAAWQNSDRQGKILRLQQEYWRGQFVEAIPVLNLPLDYPRPMIQDFSGGSVSFEFGLEETASLNKLALDQGATLYMVLLVFFYILLSRLSGQEDIVIGAPAAGRRRPELQGIFGMFVNTLALRNFPSGEKTFALFLEEVKAGTLAAFDNQEYPFEDLVERVQVVRDAGRNPLFDVMFVLQNVEAAEMEIPGLKLSPYRYESRTSKFDLTLSAEEAEGKLLFVVQYCTKLFKEETINRYIRYFKRIATSLSAGIGLRLSGIEMISAEERRQLLYDFNDIGPGYAEDKTLHGLFSEQALKTPGSTALVFAGEVVTYDELDQESTRLALALIDKGVKQPGLVGIMIERSIEMITGILGILKTGCAYVPLNPRAPEARSKYMLIECGVELLLTTRDKAESLCFPDIGIETLFIEGIEKKFNLSSPDVEAQYSPVVDLAYVIFTSGSTGKPKGVPITHSNLSPLLHWGYRNLGIDAGDRTLQNLAYYFDWSVWEIFITITRGAALYIAPDEVLLNPDACIDFINARQITVLHITPTQYYYLAGREQKTGTLKYLFIGAEKLTFDLVERSFNQVDKQCRVFNMYGPTEATIIAAVLEIDRRNGEVFKKLSSIPIGKAAGNTSLFILDKYLELCPVNVVGDLYIAGDGLAPGYLNNPELTAERFASGGQGAFLKNRPLHPQKTFEKSYVGHLSPLTIHQSPFTIHLYKTGDLARWLPDGNIEFLGRLDYQVKIRGFRIELSEIENRLLQHEAVAEAVAIVGEDEKKEKYLCAYIVSGTASTTPQELREYLSQNLPDYMIPSYFVFLERIPLTANGKIDRQSLPKPPKESAKEITGYRDEIEKKVAEIWKNVLSIPGDVGIDDNFFEAGGHSLKGAILAARIHKEFDVKISLAQVFDFPTIKKLARYIKSAGIDTFAAVAPIEKRSCYDLSFNQKRLWFIHQRDPHSSAYNMPDVIELSHDVDSAALKKAIRELSRRHESLRTGFITVADEPAQYIIPDPREIPFREIDISHMPDETEKDLEWRRIYRAEAQQLFDLTCVPLFRSVLVKLAAASFKFIFTIHHIISDGWSMEIFKLELLYLYEIFSARQTGKLDPLYLQYKDFASWQNRQAVDPAISEKSHLFWLQKVAEGVPTMEFPRNISGDSYDVGGALYRFLIPAELKESLKKLGEIHNASLFGVMFSAYLTALSRFSNREDVVCAVISAGREHESFYPIIGFFVNSILFKIQVNEEEGFDMFLSRVQADVMESFLHQSYPLEKVFEEKRMRYPDIPVAFNMVNMQAAAGAAGVNNPQSLTANNSESSELEFFEPYHEADSHDVKFDLEPYLIEYRNGIDTQWAYKKSVFDAETIEYFVRDYIKLLKFFAANPRKSYLDFKASAKKHKVALIQ